jgi:nucleotide-binding universal stress UspA family protein
MRTNRILVPLDGSELAEAALADAFDLAAGEGTVLLVRATEAHVLPGRDPIQPQIDAVADAESYMTALKGKLERRNLRNVETHVWYGPAAASIIDAAKAHKADLIVMSTHGRSGIGRLVCGSVAESVLRGTTVPILLRRPAEAPVALPAVTTQPKEVVR